MGVATPPRWGRSDEKKSEKVSHWACMEVRSYPGKNKLPGYIKETKETKIKIRISSTIREGRGRLHGLFRSYGQKGEREKLK